MVTYAAYTTVGVTAYEPKFNYRDVFKDRSKNIAQFAKVQRVKWFMSR